MDLTPLGFLFSTLAIARTRPLSDRDSAAAPIDSPCLFLGMILFPSICLVFVRGSSKKTLTYPSCSVLGAETAIVLPSLEVATALPK